MFLGLFIILKELKTIKELRVAILKQNTNHQVANDHGQEEERYADNLLSSSHAVPHRLNPLPTQDSEHNHQCMQKVLEIPSGNSFG